MELPLMKKSFNAMRIKTNVLLFVLSVGIFSLLGCKYFKKPQQSDVVEESITKAPFNGDSAYMYIAQQLEFGNRVPGSKGHLACKDFLSKKLDEFCDTVIVQSTSVNVFDGKSVPCFNIIGTFNKDVPRRILLCTHWDTRPFADQDSVDKTTPILGANDGGSGVGVLLEAARQLAIKRPEIGVDIIFFDVEDWGQPDDSKLPYKEDTYCLGTQYWAKNKHIESYSAQYGILLDMVGGKDATFTYEGTSMRYAPDLVRSVWQTAHQIGYSSYFLMQETNPIIDDHYYINQLANIPTIDIIHHDFTTPSGFPRYWHTQKDDMSSIDKGTLIAVGETLLTVLYNL